MMNFIRNRNNNKKAQSIVEFALVFPILIMMIMGMFEFGFLLKNYLGMNFALGKATKEAVLCRGQIGADLKVIKELLKGAFLIDTTCMKIIGPGNSLYGPYKLNGESVCDVNDNVITNIGQEIFYYNDMTTPNNPADDAIVDPSAFTGTGYAKISVMYTHTMLCAQILGADMAGTFILKLTAQSRMAPQ